MSKRCCLGLLIQRRDRLVKRKNQKLRSLSQRRTKTYEDAKDISRAILKNRRDIEKISKEMYGLIRKRKSINQWNYSIEI